MDAFTKDDLRAAWSAGQDSADEMWGPDSGLTTFDQWFGVTYEGWPPPSRAHIHQADFTVLDEAIDALGIAVGQRITVDHAGSTFSGLVADIRPASNGFSTYYLDDVQPVAPR